MDARRQRTLSEGLITGALGASVVSGWFLAVDLMAGQPFHTPSVLGAALFGAAPPPAGGWDPGLLAAYTVFHFAAFAVVGLIAAKSTHLSEQRPELLALFAVLFVTFELGFYGLVAVLDATGLLGGLTWFQIGAGNLLAAGSMGGFLLRAHPTILPKLQEALSR